MSTAHQRAIQALRKIISEHDDGDGLLFPTLREARAALEDVDAEKRLPELIVGHSVDRGGWCVYAQTGAGEYACERGPFSSKDEAEAALTAVEAEALGVRLPSGDDPDDYAITIRLAAVDAQPAEPLQLPPLTEVMYHAVRGSEYTFTAGGPEEVVGYMNDEMLDEVWENINTALRVARVPAEPVQEPVAWGQLGLLNGKTYLRMNYDRTPYPPPADIVRNLNLVPLYTAPPTPPQRQPLTDEQINDIGHKMFGAGYGGNADREFARAIERECAKRWGVTL